MYVHLGSDGCGVRKGCEAENIMLASHMKREAADTANNIQTTKTIQGIQANFYEIMPKIVSLNAYYYVVG